MEIEFIKKLKETGVKYYKKEGDNFEVEFFPSVPNMELAPALEEINNDRKNSISDEIVFWSNV